MADRRLKARIVSPAETVFEGDAAALVVPAWDGQFGVLPGHAPLLALLGVGELTVDLPGGGSESFQVAGGAVKVQGDEVTVLTEYAGSELPEHIPAEAVLQPEDVRLGKPANPLV